MGEGRQDEHAEQGSWGHWVKGKVGRADFDRAGGTGKVRQIYMGHRGGTLGRGVRRAGQGRWAEKVLAEHVGQSRRDR